MDMKRSLSSGTPDPGQAEQPSTSKPLKYFVWEDTPGLGHHCPICSAPKSHSSVLLHGCFGTHLMPCYKYHQNLFWPNKTLECEACNRSRKEHFKRHEAIAAALREFEKLDNDEAFTDGENPQQRHKGGRRKDNKAAKKQEKALSHKTDSVTGADIARVVDALHPNTTEHQGNETDFIELDDPGFPADLDWDYRGYAWYRQSIGPSGTVEPPDFRQQADAALVRLGVVVDGGDAAKAKRSSGKKKKKKESVVARLRALVKSDYENLWNEEVETAKRRGGFLRFINQKALDRLLALRKQRLAHAMRARAIDIIATANAAAAAAQGDGADQGGVHEAEVPPQQADHEEQQQQQQQLDDDVEAQLAGPILEQQPDTDDADSIHSEPPPEGSPVEEDTPATEVIDDSASLSSIDEVIEAKDTIELLEPEPHTPVVTDPKNTTPPPPDMTYPEDIPLPLPDDEEIAEMVFENDNIKFRDALKKTCITPARVITAKDFFQAGIYNIQQHDIWAPVRDVPLEPRPDPEKEFIDNGNVHALSPKHPRWDDWKAFKKHFRRYKDHPCETSKHLPIHDDPYRDPRVPPKFSISSIIVPMGEACHVTSARSTEEVTREMWFNNPLGCPKGHIPMMIHSQLAPFVSDTEQLAPGYLVDQFNRGDGFLAEQCWQWFLIGRLNQQNMYLREALARKHTSATRHCHGHADDDDDDDGKNRCRRCREDLKELERLEGSLAGSVERVCACLGLPTERMVRCDNAGCTTNARGPAAGHARCMDVAFAPAEGERYFCRACERDLQWFVGDEERATAARIGAALDDNNDDDGACAGTPREVLEPLLMACFKLAHAKLSPRAYAALPVARLVADVDKVLTAPPRHRRLREKDEGEAPPPLPPPSPEDLVERVFMRGRPPQGEEQRKVADFLVGMRDRWAAEGVTEEEIAELAQLEERREVERKEREVEKVKWEENGFKWETIRLGPRARKVYRPDPVRSAEAMVRWGMRREAENS